MKRSEINNIMLEADEFIQNLASNYPLSPIDQHLNLRKKKLMHLK